MTKDRKEDKIQKRADAKKVSVHTRALCDKLLALKGGMLFCLTLV